MNSKVIDKKSESTEIIKINNFLFQNISFQNQSITSHPQNSRIFSNMSKTWSKIVNYWREIEIPESLYTEIIFKVHGVHSLQVLDFINRDKIFYPDAIKLVQLIDNVD